MLDVGTGTGVLAIASKTLGTGLTVGVDIDGAAVFTARRNVLLNGFSVNQPNADFILLIGGVECVKEQFDIVAANLAAPTLLKLRCSLVLATGKLLVLSGIADALIDEVLAAFHCEDMALITRLEKEGWNSILLRRKSFRG